MFANERTPKRSLNSPQPPSSFSFAQSTFSANKRRPKPRDSQLEAKKQKLIPTIEQTESREGTTAKSSALQEEMESGVSPQDLDATQYRVTKDKIQLVKIKEYRDGKPHYVATHKVNLRDDILELESESEDLEGWYPRVTHINGMNVQLAEAIKSGRNLHEEIAKELGNHPDILYTYSSTKGLLRDLLECIEGKLGISDRATECQVEIMLNAVHDCHRVTVSAHSRGTIKTDNAVREVHNQLSNEYLDEYLKKAENNLNKYGGHTNGLKISSLKKRSDKRAIKKMNRYIKLLYAGNSVLIPSDVLKGKSFVTGTDNFLSMNKTDKVSYLTGKHHLNTSSIKLDKLQANGKGNNHEFDSCYAEAVAKEIAGSVVDELN